MKPLAVTAICFILAGCSGRFAAFQEERREAIDAIEEAALTTRVDYQQRLDRISTRWDCDGRSYASFREEFGEHHEDIYNLRCVNREFATPQPTDGAQ